MKQESLLSAVKSLQEIQTVFNKELQNAERTTGRCFIDVDTRFNVAALEMSDALAFLMGLITINTEVSAKGN